MEASPNPAPGEHRGPASRLAADDLEQLLASASARFSHEARTVLAEIERLYQARLAEKDQTIAAQAELIALLRAQAELTIESEPMAALDEPAAERLRALEAENELLRRELADRQKRINLARLEREQIDEAHQAAIRELLRQRPWWRFWR